MINVARRLGEETERELSPWELAQPEKVDYRTFVWGNISRERSYSNIEPPRFLSRTKRWS